jgi:hypothetical protein
MPYVRTSSFGAAPDNYVMLSSQNSAPGSEWASVVAQGIGAAAQITTAIVGANKPPTLPAAQQAQVLPPSGQYYRPGVFDPGGWVDRNQTALLLGAGVLGLAFLFRKKLFKGA